MADTSLFSRLQRLFSTDRIQTSGEYETNALMNRFKGIYQNPASTSLYGANFNLNYQYLRTQLYSDYDGMDTDAIVASVLDIIADESTLKNDMGEVLQIRSADDDVQKILYNLFLLITLKVISVVVQVITTLQTNKTKTKLSLIITRLLTLDYYRI